MEYMYFGRLWICKRLIIRLIELAMLQIPTMYGVGGKLLTAVQSFSVDSRAWVLLLVHE